MDSRVTRVDEIVPYLYLTGLSGVTDENVRNYNIKLVVNTASEIPRKDFQGAVTQKFDFHDIPTQNVSSYLDYVADLIHSYVNTYQAVLVHCYMGISRSTTMVLAYLIKYKNMTLNDAQVLCRSRRSIISPNIGFLRQLQEFEKRFPIYNQTNNYSEKSKPPYTYINSSYSSYYNNNNYNSTPSTDYYKTYPNEGYSKVESHPSYYSSSNYGTASTYSSYSPSYYSNSGSSSVSSKNKAYYETDYSSFNDFYNSNYYNQNSVSYAY